MNTPELSTHFQSRLPSPIRLSQIKFAERTDGTRAVNTAIGNVTLPMHPAMQERMFSLNAPDSPFKNGVMEYTPTVGTDEARKAFLNVLRASDLNTDGLFAQITDGGSQAMELVIIGCCGPAGTSEKPLLLIDAAYTNYRSMADRLGRKVVSIARTLGDDQKFTLPDIAEIKAVIQKHKPGALVVIPYDNPTGHFYNRQTMNELARICVDENIWMISDEAYRELHYTNEPVSSVWAITEEEVPGITGRRISIESASKVWNGCGLRIGALITDSPEFHQKAVAENTASLCPNAIGQHLIGALAHESAEDMKKWFGQLRDYYRPLMEQTTAALKQKLPGVMVSSPDASIYSVVDVKNIAKPTFDANDFVLYCAKAGKVMISGQPTTLLVSPMDGFYNPKPGEPNHGTTQMRIAYVVPPEDMKMVPELFAALFRDYEAKRSE